MGQSQLSDSMKYIHSEILNSVIYSEDIPGFIRSEYEFRVLEDNVLRSIDDESKRILE